MFLQFKVENFLSFDKEITFNLLASDETKLKGHIVEANRLSVLKTAALYGANASGKSNLIKSIDFSRSVIINDQFQKISYRPFKLHGVFNNNPSKFQFVFIKNDVVYDYGFTMNREQVVKEWLYLIEGDKEEVIYARTLNSQDRYDITISNKYLRKNSKERNKFELVLDTMGVKQKRQLLMTKLSDNNIRIVEPVFEWFQEMKIIYPDTKYDIMELRTSKNREFFSFLSTALEVLGTGINKVSFVTQKFDINETFEDMPSEIHERIYDVISTLEEDSLGVLEVRNRRYIFEREGNDIKVVKLMTQHRMVNGKYINFELSEESDGTQRLFDILPMVFDLCNNDRVYLFDELDRSLHTILTEFLLKFFLNHNNSSKSQLIFSTHDTNIMDLLRDDEVWLVQKNKNHSSELVSLYEYDIDDKIETVKGYLNGRFGGIPIIKELIIPQTNPKDLKTQHPKKNRKIDKGDRNE